MIRAAAFPGDGQSLAGLLLDLASDLLSAPVTRRWASLGRRLAAGCGRWSPPPATRITAAGC